MTTPFFLLLALMLVLSACTSALQPSSENGLSRRAAFAQVTSATAAVALAGLPSQAKAATSNGIKLTESPSGLKWADAKVGTGQPLTKGATASIDYSMASTAGRFPQIYTTKDTGSPYRWKLGDGSTIAGIELAILGDEKEGIPPMIPGSIRRVIIPAKLGYQSLAAPNSKCIDGEPGSIGPIPPKENLGGTGAYQRWYQFYCNPRIPYQPDLVLDIKL